MWCTTSYLVNLVASTSDTGAGAAANSERARSKSRNGDAAHDVLPRRSVVVDVGHWHKSRNDDAADDILFRLDLLASTLRRHGSLISLTKPSWVVRTESNVKKKRRKKPDPHCVVCEGSGRVDCHQCCGKGTTNKVYLEMLPKGEWPKWCRTCGGSGLGYCSRCLRTGEYRYIMGFHFMNRDSELSFCTIIII
ncbi:uncharacterized protein [Arachis hypogaea]|uniref:uncharacterized protein n=1 Tax=Arachis hypogaea TaxID=3818 RepID=UPI000DEC68EC